MPHVLIIDDDADTRTALAALVVEEGCSVVTAGDLREARIQMTRQTPDAVLIDITLPDGNGLELIEDLERRSTTEVILMTGNATVETAIEALRQGAADYLVKPVNMTRLRAILARIPRTADLKAEIGSLRGELRQLGHFGRMLGRSAAMQQFYDQVGRVAATEATVLLVGESGTGKELAAQSLHEMSRRARKPFLAVNCGAITPTLIESEMFGHERGSFTGAERQHHGYFERAYGGTLFLDEITEMAFELQVKLLRVLEVGRFMRVGTDREIETDVRVIAATNRDPQEAVAEGKLRADLFHRLNVFPLHLPPLREREGDVQLLAAHFLDELNRTHGTSKTLPAAAAEQLAKHAWPGNVRELRNFMQRAFILGDDIIDARTLKGGLSPERAASVACVDVPVGTTLAEADRRLILATLAQCGGVKKHAAHLLGISLKTLYNRLEEYGLQGHERGAHSEQGAEASNEVA